MGGATATGVEPGGMTEWPEHERELLYLQVLEGRRNTFDTSMWQAPALTIAAQAFLLQVQVSARLNVPARVGVLIAAVAAVAAATFSLLRLRAREVRYSDEIAQRMIAAGVGDPRPPALPAEQTEQTTRWGHWDKALREFANGLAMPAYLWWVLALILFALADVAVFISALSDK